MKSLATELEELELSDPEVRKAAENYDKAVAKIRAGWVHDAGERMKHLWSVIYAPKSGDELGEALREFSELAKRRFLIASTEGSTVPPVCPTTASSPDDAGHTPSQNTVNIDTSEA